MNRRDFLLFCSDGGAPPLAELSCEKLFMHYRDMNSGFQQAAVEQGTPDDDDWWCGEPPLHVNSQDPESFFRSVLDDLDGVRRIRVRDMEWLSQGEFRVRVETLLAAFKARGGEVEYGAVSLDRPSPERSASESTTPNATS